MTIDVPAPSPSEGSPLTQLPPDYSTVSTAETGIDDDYLCMGVEKNNLWEIGQNICVKFIGGTAKLHGIVKYAAKEWEQHANITFSFVLNEPSDIRVSFMEGKGSYSLVGTKALDPRYTGRSTMNLDITKQHPSIQRSTVLHEFGHVLGCIHEHCLPEANIQWNINAVYAYCESIGWCKQKADGNILLKYQPDAILCSSSADFDSIMMYHFPPLLASSPLPTNPNLHFSIEDQKFISSVYPKPNPPSRTSTL